MPALRNYSSQTNVERTFAAGRYLAVERDHAFVRENGNNDRVWSNLSCFLLARGSCIHPFERRLLRDKFPRISIPSPAEPDIRQLLRHRHKLVCLRTSVKNQLHGIATSQGIWRKKKLWTSAGHQQLESLALGSWASRRRRELLQMLDQLDPVIEEVDGFQKSKQVVSYLGLNPSEDSSGGRQRLGVVSKQGNSMMRWLLCEAAQTAARLDPELRRLSTVEVPPWQCGGEGSDRTKGGGAAVLEAARAA